LVIFLKGGKIRFISKNLPKEYNIFQGTGDLTGM